MDKSRTGKLQALIQLEEAKGEEVEYINAPQRFILARRLNGKLSLSSHSSLQDCEEKANSFGRDGSRVFDLDTDSQYYAVEAIRFVKEE